MDARREGGADLPAAVRARLVEIDGELAELSRTFSQNSVKANKGFEIYFEDASALDGLLPEHLMKAEESAKKAGKTGYRLSLADGTAGQAMGRVHNEATREAIWRKMEPLHRTGETNNLPVAQRILELRREQAEILGFENYADLATTTRMVKNGASAEAFVDDLAAKLRDAAQQEYDEFRAFRKSVDGKDTFERWDGAYWSRKFSESRLDLDALREYFTIDNAIDAFRMTAEKLYGIRFEETKPAVWHPEVRSFEVLDHDGRLLGRFQLDLVSRDGKRSGAWHMSVNKGLGDEPTTSVIVGNLPQPTPDGKPSLIGLGGATTIFHELGHGLHGVFSEARLRSLNGTAVARDFVELPSQLMENFVWEKPVFDVLARHWKTGEPMPAELRDALYATRTEGAAGGQFGSLANAKLDIGLHRHYTGKTPEELEAFAEKLLSDFVLDGSTARPWRMVPQFGHIFSGGYASGYYGYSWAEVLDADAFTKFQADGTLSRSVGDSFRRELLSKGGTADPDVLFRNFMGRDPDPGAHVRRMGIEP
jgi:oligopeptidase A